MKRDPNSVGFNKIYILQHLRKGDRKTGEEIEKITKYSSMQRSPEVLCELVNIDAPTQFFETLEQISSIASSHAMVPYIHFEFHGCKDGLEIDHQLVAWESLKAPLLKINRITKNNLFISVATCFGAYLFKILSLREPSPFFGYIGPENTIEAEELEVNFSAFFESLLKESSFDAAIESLNGTIANRDGGTKYSFLSCYGLFDMQLAKFMNRVDTARKRNDFVNEATTHTRENLPESKLSVNEIRTKAKRLLETSWSMESIERMRSIFTHESETIN